jgi:hypothetical protein
LNGLTNSDFYQIENVLRHWAAGIHYAKRSAMAAAPGSVFLKIEHPDVFTKLNLPPMPSGKWIANDGHEFGRWWFLPGKDPTESITVFNLLFGESLWYLVRFPRLTQNE